MDIQSRQESGTGKMFINLELSNKELLDLVDDKAVVQDTKLLCVNIVMKEGADGKTNKA